MTGESDAQKQMEKEQKRLAAEAMQKKIIGIQDDIGTRTRDLIRRYGIGGTGGGSTSSPLMK